MSRQSVREHKRPFPQIQGELEGGSGNKVLCLSLTEADIWSLELPGAFLETFK